MSALLGDPQHVHQMLATWKRDIPSKRRREWADFEVPWDDLETTALLSGANFQQRAFEPVRVYILRRESWVYVYLVRTESAAAGSMIAVCHDARSYDKPFWQCCSSQWLPAQAVLIGLDASREDRIVITQLIDVSIYGEGGGTMSQRVTGHKSWSSNRLFGKKWQVLLPQRRTPPSSACEDQAQPAEPGQDNSAVLQPAPKRAKLSPSPQPGEPARAKRDRDDDDDNDVVVAPAPKRVKLLPAVPAEPVQRLSPVQTAFVSAVREFPGLSTKRLLERCAALRLAAAGETIADKSRRLNSIGGDVSQLVGMQVIRDKGGRKWELP
jgi:hypothetical protein